MNWSQARCPFCRLLVLAPHSGPSVASPRGGRPNTVGPLGTRLYSSSSSSLRLCVCTAGQSCKGIRHGDYRKCAIPLRWGTRAVRRGTLPPEVRAREGRGQPRPSRTLTSVRFGSGSAVVRSSKLPMYPASSLVRAQPQKCSVPQPSFGSPLHESDLSDELGPGPYELAHLLGRDPASPSRSTGWEVGKRTILRAERLQMAAELASDVRGEARTHLAGELELRSLEAPNHQRMDAAPTVRSESADHELLLTLELQFQPIIRSLAGLIHRAPALCDHALESE